MNEMQFSIAINAAKERVWATLWQDATFRDWASIIDPETYKVGDLQEGNEIQFISAANGYGVTSLAETVRPGEFLRLRHRADTQETGSREREPQWTGSAETYTLAEEDGVTTLAVAFGVPPELEEYFEDAYPKALQRVKELAEREP